VPGWAEADADTWWVAARDVLRQLVAAVGRDAVAAVGVTGQAPTLLAVDAAGHPLGPAILWLDVRSEREAGDLAARLGHDAERIGGNRLHAYYLGPKLEWMRRHAPARFAATATVLQSHSYPVFRLTGARVTDHSSAALCAPLYDAVARDWSGEMCARMDLGGGMLPEIMPAHAVAGTVTATGARATGLPEGVPVVVGGADFAASALAAGVTEPGEACLMLGTAGNLIAVAAAQGFDTRLINAHHVGCDRHLALGATLCGGVLEWFRGVSEPGAAFARLDAEAAAIPAGAEGLRMLPYLAGERTPVWDAAARGAFVGLTLAHGRAHLYRAALESVAVSFRHCLEVMREGDLRLHGVIAVDGGARSALWRQILCDALGVPLAYLAENRGAPAGGAILAGIGAGVLEGVDAAKRWRGRLERHEPDPARGATYAGLLAERLDLYDRLRRAA
jgi:xylulokinase